jgi:hypothetical protein
MRKNKLVKLLAALLLTLLLLFGSWGLYSLRYRGSDLYPFYSSFRADRMGAKALYLSLKSFPELSVARNLRPTDEIQEKQNLCLFVLGCHPQLFKNNFDKIEDCALTGARVVVSFTPDFSRQPECPACAPPAKKKKKPEFKAEKASLLKESKSGVAGVVITSLERPIKLPGKAVPEKALKLPAFKVFSRNCFEIEREGWDVLYTLRGKPLMLEKKYKGGGSIVFCADSYIFSNESLAADNNAAVLLFLLNGRTEILFDETHLGGSTIQEYRLAGPEIQADTFPDRFDGHFAFVYLAEHSASLQHCEKRRRRKHH